LKSKLPGPQVAASATRAPAILFLFPTAGGDDTGFSEMTDAQCARAIALFNWRKNKPTKLRWFEQLPKYGE
jgi:hypothetical protein